MVNGKRQKRGKFAVDFLDKRMFKCVEGRPKDKSKLPVFVRRPMVGEETVVLCRSDGRRDNDDANLEPARKGVDRRQAVIWLLPSAQFP